MFGYNGKILEVNLSNNEIKTIKLKEEDCKKFLGGTGLAAKFFYDYKSYKVEAFSPENPLIFITGPLTGFNLPGASRFEVCGRSPLTGIWGEASCGGGFGPELKWTGYDGIIIFGKAKNPVYLYVGNDKVEIKDASSFWGKDTYEVEDLFKKELSDKKIKIVSIGIAGENKVLYSAIVSERGNVAGRCGLGALMGDKFLKAICVKGKLKMEVKDRKGLENLRRELNEKIKLDSLCAALHQYGTASGMQLGAIVGDVPTKNWRKATCDFAKKIDGVAITENILLKTKACPFCPVGCKRIVKIEDKQVPGPEYESCAALGSLLNNDDLILLTKLNEQCNRYGMDTISCGSSIAFAKECFEQGLITKKDTDGLDLSWENKESNFKIMEMIATRSGIGNILADGVRSASKKIPNSEKFAISVKGLEVPMHDPRAYHGLALAYATSIRGACHVNSINLMIEMGMTKYPEIGIKNYQPLSSEGKAHQTVKAQDIGQIYGSAVLCYYIASMISTKDILNMINTTTEFNLTLDEMLKAGERIWYLKRFLNGLMGMKKEDDNLPQRLLEPFIEGTTPGVEKIIAKIMSTKPIFFKKAIQKFVYDRVFPHLHRTIKLLDSLSFITKQRMRKNPFLVVPDFKTMVSLYYSLRKLKEDGFPEEEKLKELELDFLFISST